MSRCFSSVLMLIALISIPGWALLLGTASFSLAAHPVIASPPLTSTPGIPVFTIQDLGTLGGAESDASSINDLSQAAGSSLTAAGIQHAFLFSSGTMTDLGALGSMSSSAAGINNLGHVVGNSLAGPQAAPHAFYYARGRMLDLGTLGGLSSAASGLDDADEVAGYSFIPVAGYSLISGIAAIHAFLYSDGKMSDLGTLGGPTSTATAISAIGQVIGNSFTAVGSAQHAFLYSDGKMRDLGTLGGTNSAAAGINALGQVAGHSFIEGDSAFHTFLSSGGSMSDLRTLGGPNSSANGINGLGQVVGESDTPSGSEHAYFWQSGVMVDLNGQITSGSGWELTTAASINDGGEIVGSGTHGGQQRAFLLTPNDGATLTPAEVSSATAAIGVLINQLGVPSTAPISIRLRFNYLITKLQVARVKLEQNSRAVAINLLRSFIALGSTLTGTEMAPAKRQALMDAAQAVIAQIES